MGIGYWLLFRGSRLIEGVFLQTIFNTQYQISTLSVLRSALAPISDRLIEHWDVESVPRAIASEAPASSLLRKPRSLPLAVLTRNQHRER